MWTVYLFVNLWLLTLEARFIRLAVLYKSAAWNLTWIIGNKKRYSPTSEPFQKAWAVGEEEHEQLEARIWFHRYRTFLTERAILYGIAFITAIVLCLTLLIYFNADVFWTSDAPMAPHCQLGWVYYPFYVLGIMHLLFLVGLALAVRKCSDVYGIRRELYVSVVVGILSFLLVRTLDASEMYAWLGTWYENIVWLFAGMMISHLMATVYPLLVLKSRCTTADLEAAEFISILKTPDLFEEFKAFSVKDFTIENVLFHEHFHHFHKTFALKEGSMSRSSVRLLRDMYHTFIKPNAPMELNLTSATMQAARRKFLSGRLEQDMLDQVDNEVLELLKYNTFPRFLWFKKQQGTVEMNNTPKKVVEEEDDGMVTSAYYSKQRQQDIEDMNRSTYL